MSTPQFSKIKPDLMKNSLLKLMSCSCVTLMFLFSASMLIAQATLITDAADYSPGSTATFYGSGFIEFETVIIEVSHADGIPDSGADHDEWSVAADFEGNFTTTWHVCEDDCFGSSLKATASGETSELYAE